MQVIEIRLKMAKAVNKERELTVPGGKKSQAKILSLPEIFLKTMGKTHIFPDRK